MNKFCPICKKVLLQTNVGGINYFCQTRIKFEGKASIPHYKQDCDSPVEWYAPPYKLSVNDTGTKIYEVIDEPSSVGRFTQPDFKFLFETKAIFKPDDQEKIIQRIKKLIIFS